MANPIMELAEAHHFHPFWLRRETAILDLTSRALEYFAQKHELQGRKPLWKTTLTLLDASRWEDAAGDIMRDIGIDLGCSSSTVFLRECLAELLSHMSAKAVVWRRERLEARRRECEQELARLDEKLQQADEV